MPSLRAIALPFAAIFLLLSAAPAMPGDIASTPNGHGTPPPVQTMGKEGPGGSKLKCKIYPHGKACGFTTNGGGGNSSGDPLDPLQPPATSHNGTLDQQDQCYLDCTGHNSKASSQDVQFCQASCYGNAPGDKQ